MHHRSRWTRRAGIGILLGVTLCFGQAADSLRIKAETVTRPFYDLIQAHADESGVDPALIMAIITVESRGDPNAYSSAGAMGLMQLMPATCEDYGVSEPYNPDANIRGGASLLANHLNRYKGDLKKVLAAYNAGAARADDGSWARISETRRYVPLVLSYYAALRPGGDGWQPTTTVTIPAQLPPAGPPIRYLDMMFETVRASQIQIEPTGVAENGTLDNAAEIVLEAYFAGKTSSAALQNVAARELKKAKFGYKTMKAFSLTTPDAEGFASVWAKQPNTPGGMVGLAHSANPTGHVWIVILAGG